MTTNAELIWEARVKPSAIFHHGYFPDVADDLIPRLADALEAASFELEGLREIATSPPSIPTSEPGLLQSDWMKARPQWWPKSTVRWPADLLEAVDRLTDSNCDCTLTEEEAKEPRREQAEAVATLRRYGLLPEEAAHAD